MNLRDFILENENWEQLLTAAPYNLKISRDGGYIMFKYNQIASDFSLRIVQEARGVIFDESTWDVVCKPFDKFFNYAEPHAAAINWNGTLRVTEKIDGSLMKVWYHNGKWHLSTNGTIDARKAPTGSDRYPNFYELFLACAGVNSLEDFACHFFHEFTYLFEMVSPENRCVVPYKDRKLYYLTSFYNVTGAETFFSNVGIDSPAQITVHSLAEILAIVEQFDWDREGYVVYDGENRIKVKGKAYVMAHYARNNNQLNTCHLMEVIVSNEVDEFLTYADDYAEEISVLLLRMQIAKYTAICLKHDISGYLNQDYSKRLYAGKVMELAQVKYRDYLFKLYDNPELSWDDYVAKWTAAKWVKFLEQ